MDIKENFAKNLTNFRKQANLTQVELAEKLNYSDKAVSKWERGESIPDLYALKNIADLFDVTIDTLIKEHPVLTPTKTKSKKRSLRLTIAICSTALVWLVALCAFACINMIIPSIEHTWMALVYALPVTMIVLLVLTSVWNKKITTGVIISLLIWSTIISVFFTLYYLLATPPANLWMLFLIGIPLQIIIVFWSIYRKIK
ncbi:MAG: helix-turn-helix transcriptional regulator [Clostridia bacterium]|nr:helix-turn-helix transcriptional regulator [Clostridia bacterium]